MDSNILDSADVCGDNGELELPRCSSSNWTSALVEELLEKNVIDPQNMSILKGHHFSGATDPALLSDLRHDKGLRAEMLRCRPQIPSSNVMAEARRILKEEDKARKNICVQNKIVDEEVDRFQNHITNLRKMNQRLERIAYPLHNPHKKKKNQLYNQLKMHDYHMQDEFSIDKHIKELDTPVNYEDTPKLKCVNNVKNFLGDESNAHEMAYKSTTKSTFKKKAALSVSGQKVDGHDFLKPHPVPFSDISPRSQNTVFERIHQKYIESERDRVLKEGASLIRHSSPIDESEKFVTQSAVICTSEESFEKNVQIKEWIDHASPLCNPEIPPVKENQGIRYECHLPKATPRKFNLRREERQQCSPLSETLAPPIALKGGDQSKLESMSKMYAKWMTNVCVSPNTKFEPAGKEGKKIEGSFFNQPKKTDITREEKITQVLLALQKHKESRATNSVEKVDPKSTRFSKSANDIREERVDLDKCKFRRAISGSYEHRLKAHKDVITHQKAKLEEQKRQIEDLKLSQLKMETEKSKLETKETVNEIMESCNPRVKAQAKFLMSSLSLAELSPGNSFILRMEQRALEQRQKKLLAQQRRKQFEEEWKKKIKDAEEKKRLEEEELIKKKHEEAQEMRRKERELREDARKEREKMIALERKAEIFSQQRKLKLGFAGIKKLVVLRKKQQERAEEFYKEYLMRMAFKSWRGEVEVKLKARMTYAGNFYLSSLLHRCFNALKEEAFEATKRMQVAVDMHDLHLQERFFRAWLRYTHEEQEICAEKVAKATEHFRKLVLQKYLAVWKRLPEVAQSEREKERRKMVWRTKVQQLLPDYRPLLSSD